MTIEVNNECDVPRYEHAILQPHRATELIERSKSHQRDGRLLAGTSYAGGRIPGEPVAAASDFLLLHGNGVEDPDGIEQMVRRARALTTYRPMPILFNEDDHYAFEQPKNNMVAAISQYASWGLLDSGENNYRDGYQRPPVNWGINTDRKRAFFGKVKEITGGS